MYTERVRRTLVVIGSAACLALAGGCNILRSQGFVRPPRLVYGSSHIIIPPRPARTKAQKLYDIAVAKKGAGDTAGYLRYLEKAAAADPVNVGFFDELASYYYEAKDYKRALPYYRKLTDRKDRIRSSTETDPAILARWGETELKVGTKEKAREAFVRAVANGKRYYRGHAPIPTFAATETGQRAEAHFGAALAMGDSGHYKFAAEEYQLVLSLSPASSELKNHREQMLVLDKAQTSSKSAIYYPPKR